MSRAMRGTLTIAALVIMAGGSVAYAAGGGGDAGGGGGGGCVPDGSCSAPSPSCGQISTFGVDNCGEPCEQVFWEAWDNCTAPEPSCTQMHTTGTTTCGFPCDDDFNNYCQAPSPDCGQTTTGTRVCGQACSKNGGTCNTWEPYGYAVPGDPKYSFGLEDNNTKGLLGLAAKGNMIIGDYTSQEFQDLVLPKIGNGSESLTQAYAIDPTDDTLGYHDDSFTADNLPRFSGNYDQQDANGTGVKLDDTPRKFYESSLPDDQFLALLDESWIPGMGGEDGGIMAVLFTNHLMAGYAPFDDNFYQFGSMVARDDAFMFADGFWSDHDARLSGAGSGQIPSTSVGIGLPMSVSRPVLRSWRECPPDPAADCSS